jgi:hypothetical protein
MNALDWTRESEKACFCLEINILVDDVFKASDWRRASQKACFGLEVTGLVDDVLKAWDWRRASHKAWCGLEVKAGSDECQFGSFEEPTSDLCHNSPESLTQIGLLLC